jgi:hypothetical protein
LGAYEEALLDPNYRDTVSGNTYRRWKDFTKIFCGMGMVTIPADYSNSSTLFMFGDDMKPTKGTKPVTITRKQFISVYERFTYTCPCCHTIFELNTPMINVTRYRCQCGQELSVAQENKEVHGEVANIFRWLLGIAGDFPLREEGQGDYYWRKHLHDKLKDADIDI